MTISLGEEFNNIAMPGQELLRKLVYLATQDNDSVLTGGAKSPRSPYSAHGDKAARTADALMMARLSDAAYQALSARIENKLIAMDEASVRALQEIEEELTDLRREREQMLEEAYRDEQGRRIFMTNDGSTAYYEDRTKLHDHEFQQHREHLRGKPTWDQFQALEEREHNLSAERDGIHEHDAQREQLRDDLATGRISKEEAERRERELEESQPDRLQRAYEAGLVQRSENKPAVDTTLNPDELAELNSRGGPVHNDQSGADTPSPGAVPPP